MTALAAMMAAMMLPAAVPATVQRARTSVRAALLFLASYLAMWAAIGAVMHVLYRPPSVFVAGLITIAAGLYELTPLKRSLRVQCRGHVSGLRFGAACAASCIGLMVMQSVLGMMDLTWMAAVAAIVAAQKILPPMRILDASLGVAIVALGMLIAFAPYSILAITLPVFLASGSVCG
ncbi:MAG TPA: DUF2182 domain-containing protein [Candidatus Acidoferrales bacterium]|nr:DUF2182 domain-containing protein [Candidatus Acidoferrales bacterium]